MHFYPNIKGDNLSSRKVRAAVIEKK